MALGSPIEQNGALVALGNDAPELGGSGCQGADRNGGWTDRDASSGRQGRERPSVG